MMLCAVKSLSIPKRTRFSAPAPAIAPETPPASQPWTLLRLFRVYRTRVLFTYGLFTLENLLRLAQPWVLGTAVNSLLGQRYFGLLWLLVHALCFTLVTVSRRMYDTRAFRGIYADLASRIVPEQRRRSVAVSRVAARSVLSREMVDFFERDVPIALYALYSILGAAAMLWLYDRLLVAVCLLLLPTVWLLGRSYGRKTLEINSELNDRLEREVDVIDRGCRHETREHYTRVGRSHVKLADLEGMNFAGIQFFVFGLTALALVRCSSGTGTGAGNIFAILGYVMMYVSGLAMTPQLVQQINRLRDIGRRLQVPADVEE